MDGKPVFDRTNDTKGEWKIEKQRLSSIAYAYTVKGNDISILQSEYSTTILARSSPEYHILNGMVARTPK